MISPPFQRFFQQKSKISGKQMSLYQVEYTRRNAMRLFVIVGLLLGACATPRLQSAVRKREEERLQMLLRRNQELIENIRYYEAKLDTLEKMCAAQVKGLLPRTLMSCAGPDEPRPEK